MGVSAIFKDQLLPHHLPPLTPPSHHFLPTHHAQIFSNFNLGSGKVLSEGIVVGVWNRHELHSTCLQIGYLNQDGKQEGQGKPLK